MRVRLSKRRFGTAAAFVMAVMTFAIIMATMPPPLEDVAGHAAV
jgi:hypothetical protein